MKTKVISLLTSALLLFVISNQSAAAEMKEKKATKEFTADAIAEAKTDINNMVVRVNEINEMDFETLTRAEKKELRKEVRSIKKDLRAYGKSDSPAIAEAAAKGADGAGIYISGGAIIVILLILLLL